MSQLFHSVYIVGIFGTMSKVRMPVLPILMGYQKR